MKEISVLILCPHPSVRGGVADYYRMLKSHFHSDRVALYFYYTGKGTSSRICQNRIFKSATDLLALFKVFRNMDLIVLNPSLDPKAVIRDGLFHFIAKKVFCKKTLVFFHGWTFACERAIERYFKAFFRMLFDFDMGLVLASQFRNTLIRWGVDPAKITLETTLYAHHESDVCKNRFHVIFLSRFAQEKGCLEAIQTVEILSDEFPEVRLFMAGDGEIMPELKQYVADRNLGSHIEFTGWITGEKKMRLLQQCGSMLFPTSYGEGMPVSILEGMGAGQAIITRPVAGIRDILTDQLNGYLLESGDPHAYAAKLKFLFQHEDTWQKITHSNKLQATETFEAGLVARRIERLYRKVMQ